MEQKYIIGIQVGETAGAAIYKGGKIIYAASEERFTRKKNDLSYPQGVIRNAISRYNITSDKIEKVVVATEKNDPVKFLVNPSSFSIADWVKEEQEYYYPLFFGGRTVPRYIELFRDKCLESEYQDLYEQIKNNESGEDYGTLQRWITNRLQRDLGVGVSKIEFLKHEFCHAAYGFYGSPWRDFKDVMCVVFDGWGDESNASIYTIEDGIITQNAKYDDFNIGRIYKYLTLLLGMKPLEHEYKVMGLAPYATEYTYREPLEVFRKAYDFIDGKVVVDPELRDHYYYFRDRLEGMRFDGIAAGLQVFTEEMITKLVTYWIKKTGKRRVVLSGGVSLNVKANHEVGKIDAVRDLFVPGSAGDESHCMGSIFLYLNQQGRGNEIEIMHSLYLGDGTEENDIRFVLDDARKKGFVVRENVSAKTIAEELATGRVLGRIAGRMEFGARALGNRSILADPRHYEIVSRINRKIKNRDFWMPFTPSILKENEKDYLVNPKGLSFPYMTIACDTTEQGRGCIPAAIHPSDFTARPEIVSSEYNREYYDIIKQFKELTGVGALLNTSLNLHGYPIVRTVLEAYKVFENSDLDGLVIENNLITRENR